MRSLYVGERDVVDFSMVLAITAASVGHVILGLKGSEARVRLVLLSRSTDVNVGREVTLANTDIGGL